MSEYHINLFWSDEDECWIADIPDLKFCSAHGETPDEALREVMVAKKAWLASAKAHRQRVPKPVYRPAIYALPA
jgi:predicted RNase H-like HicB family nuclease